MSLHALLRHVGPLFCNAPLKLVGFTRSGSRRLLSVEAPRRYSLLQVQEGEDLNLLRDSYLLSKEEGRV